MLNTEATQHIKATLAAFGPNEAISFTQDTWANLHEAMSVLIEQSAHQEPLTPEQILHRVDTHVGGPSPSYQLDNSDWINFARAIEAAHNITGEKK